MEKGGNDMLFSQRFQTVYESLGVFSMLSALNYYRPVCKCCFIRETRLSQSSAEDIIGLLTRNRIITERDGMLQLNRKLFFKLTMWDFLVMVEPWLGSKAPPGELKDGYEELKNFSQAEKLSTALIAC